MFSDLGFDVRFALRMFRKRPGFTAVAVLTLALGIGAATAVFSIVEAVLLRPLPYNDPGRLAAIWLTSVHDSHFAKIYGFYSDYLEFRRHSRTLEAVGAATWAFGTGHILTGNGPARTVLTIPATVSFFETLGVPAVLGRTFRSEDESRGCSMVLAHDFWTSSLGGDPAIIGKSLTFDDKPCVVVGVMPRKFGFYPPRRKRGFCWGP